MWVLIVVVQKYYANHSIDTLHNCWPKISKKTKLILQSFIRIYWTKINVSKKRHRYNDAFNIMFHQVKCWYGIVSRLLTAKFTTISFTMPLEREMKYPFLLKRTLYHGRQYMIILWKHENLASIFCTLAELHMQV